MSTAVERREASSGEAIPDCSGELTTTERARAALGVVPTPVLDLADGIVEPPEELAELALIS